MSYCKEEEQRKTDCPQLKQKTTIKDLSILCRRKVRNPLNEEAQGLLWT